ncbi:hypothetical protein ACFQ1S_32915, partial [Kibdelosporangium lantanae]
MDVRYSTNPGEARGYDTAELRRHYLVEDVFVTGEVRLTYSHEDRVVRPYGRCCLPYNYLEYPTRFAGQRHFAGLGANNRRSDVDCPHAALGQPLHFGGVDGQ